MADNELDTLSAGDIAPYSEGPVLAPLSPSPWANTDVLISQEINDYQRQPQSPTLFGAAMPAGTSRAQVEAILGQLGGAFMADLSSLGYPAHMVNAAISFMTANATKAPYQVTRQHNFNLHGHDDWLGNAFGNMVQNLSGSAKAKQGFVTACLQWLSKACKQLGQQQVGTQPPRMAPHSAEALLNQLSDADYNKVVKINEQARARTMQVLATKYGEYSVQQVIDIGQRYLESLPAHERAHFGQFTTGWVHSLNTVEVVEALYNMAIGANSIGDGADLAKEIASFEAMLKIPAERAKYMRDPVLQSRLVELYRRRGS